MGHRPGLELRVLPEHQPVLGPRGSDVRCTHHSMPPNPPLLESSRVRGVRQSSGAGGEPTRVVARDHIRVDISSSSHLVLASLPYGEGGVFLFLNLLLCLWWEAPVPAIFEGRSAILSCVGYLKANLGEHDNLFLPGSSYLAQSLWDEP